MPSWGVLQLIHRLPRLPELHSLRPEDGLGFDDRVTDLQPLDLGESMQLGGVVPCGLAA